jgi:translation initiation factor 2 subunit 3
MTQINNILNNQPIVRIGMLGSVSHGKSTFVNKVTGIKTQKHSSEKTRNITIKQGYANMKLWSHNEEKQSFYPTDSNINSMEDYTLVNHISFIDCPGHQEYIDTMLSSVNMMDGAIIIVAADQKLSQNPQLVQHLAAVSLYNVKKLIVCINKVDLVERHIVMERKEELDNMLEKYNITPHVIIPTSFNKMIGIKYVLESIMELYNPTEYLKNVDLVPLFKTSRSFDINKPGTNWDDVNGGVIGGTLFSGSLKVGDIIEIRPGQVSKQKDKYNCTPFKTVIQSIKTDNMNLDSIIPGGLIAIGTELDPFYCKKDAMSGNIVGLVGMLPSVYQIINMNCTLVTTFGFNWIPKENDSVMLSIGTRMCEARLCKKLDDIYTFELMKPVCIEDNMMIVICRTIDKILRIVGKGDLVESIKLVV